MRELIDLFEVDNAGSIGISRNQLHEFIRVAIEVEVENVANKLPGRKANFFSLTARNIDIDRITDELIDWIRINQRR